MTVTALILPYCPELEKVYSEHVLCIKGKSSPTILKQYCRKKKVTADQHVTSNYVAEAECVGEAVLLWELAKETNWPTEPQPAFPCVTFWVEKIAFVHRLVVSVWQQKCSL